jgi:fructose-specific phosphotransferase system component IIB
MKVKLTISDVKKFEVACEATDIRIDDRKNYGTKAVLLVNVKHPSQLYEAGLIQATLTESDLQPVKEVKEEAKEQVKPELKTK